MLTHPYLVVDCSTRLIPTKLSSSWLGHLLKSHCLQCPCQPFSVATELDTLAQSCVCQTTSCIDSVSKVLLSTFTWRPPDLAPLPCHDCCCLQHPCHLQLCHGILSWGQGLGTPTGHQRRNVAQRLEQRDCQGLHIHSLQAQALDMS